VPDDLFNQRKLEGILNYSDPAGSTYYKAILQNLFFATLNQEMNTPQKPDNRKFRSRNKTSGGRDPHYNITNLYRYEDYFRNPAEALALFSQIPFLNGGLFECLDKENKDDPAKILRIDGFSDRADNEVCVPDFLFFCKEEKEVDLNESYGTTNKRYKVRGLIDIFSRYKFTIDENTPIEEEVALDPELLGKVFENLLATYNPETRATARKQTGSYYTPREIVNYMVDESLIAYLDTQLKERIPALQDMESLTELLREVFAYTEKVHPFNTEEVSALIEAIDGIKILDPACGSGALPMGILHKLVFILSKLDPNNERWKDRQLTKEAEAISDITIRDKAIADIEAAFERNELNYGRKLYLIENCIYGVDIQPIAVQIARLRFFISLVVDQRIDEAQGNRGIIPLPNLETKFVAANTLIGLDRPQQPVLRNAAIAEREERLAGVRKRHFTARTLKSKRKCREEDRQLRAEISELLGSDGFPRETTEKLAYWDPYDQNASADFFDPEWMFGVSEGFDLIIANPPYLEARSPSFSEDIKSALQLAAQRRWGNDAGFIARGADLLIYFFETSLFLLNRQGYIVFIAQNSWLNTEYGRKFQTFLLRHTQVKAVIDSSFKHFDSSEGPNINTVISVFHGKVPSDDNVLKFVRYHLSFEEVATISASQAVATHAVEFAAYRYSDSILHELKWGTLHDAIDPVFQELLDTMTAKGCHIEKVPHVKLSVGQGLNLTAAYVVTHDFMRMCPLGSKALIPFFTSDDGAPFDLAETKTFIIDCTRLSKPEQKVLRSLGIKAFDPSSTRKVIPTLIMPRGIGRHFCAINSASAFSASGVDIYSDSRLDRKTLLNLWLFLNSSVAWLIREVSGRKNLGGGMLKAEAVDLKYFPLYFDFPDTQNIGTIFGKLKSRSALNSLDEIETTEHQEIDAIVFHYLNLDSAQRKTLVDLLKSKISERQRKSRT